MTDAGLNGSPRRRRGLLRGGWRACQPFQRSGPRVRSGWAFLLGLWTTWLVTADTRSFPIAGGAKSLDRSGESAEVVFRSVRPSRVVPNSWTLDVVVRNQGKPRSCRR